MPPLPLDERIVLVQRPKSLPLHPAPSQALPPPSKSCPSPPSPPFPPPRKPRPRSLPHPSSTSSSSGERRRRSPRARRPKPKAHTHTIDITFSLGEGGGVGGATVPTRAQVGSLGRTDKKVSLHLDVEQGERSGRAGTLGRAGPQESLQNHTQSRRRARTGSNQPGQPLLPLSPIRNFRREPDQDPPPQTSSRPFREVPSTTNKENSQLGVELPPATPHASILNAHRSAPPFQHPCVPARRCDQPLAAPQRRCSSPDYTHTHAYTRTLDPSHPLGCSCWRLSRRGGRGFVSQQGPASAVMGLKNLGGCLSASSTTNTSSSNSTVSECRPSGLHHPLACRFGSPVAFRRRLVGGCLPCAAPLSSSSSSSAPLRALQSCVGGCDPRAGQGGSSTCSYCSSDPIVLTFNPHRVHRDKAAGTVSGDEDDYSVRTIWPEELAKKMNRSRAQPNGTAQLPLDCRNLLEFTRSQLTDQAGRRRLHQGKMAMLDFMGSNRDAGGDSLKRLWPKGGDEEESRHTNGYSDEPLPPCSPGPRSPPPSFSPPPTFTRPKHRDGESARQHQPNSVMNLLSREQDEETRKAPTTGEPALSLPLSSFLPSSLSDEAELSPDVENAPLSPILPFLFLGNERDAQDLELLLRLNIAYVVNVTNHLPLYHQTAGLVRYKRLPATDSSKQNLRQYFEEVFEFIEEAHQSGRGVLVHCQAGVSRSATIVIAYLMKHTRMTMMDAYKYVRSRRPVVSPNLNFMGQLLEFERDLNSGVTPRILTPKLTGLETQV